jgi:hypothetical protein
VVQRLLDYKLFVNNNMKRLAFSLILILVSFSGIFSQVSLIDKLGMMGLDENDHPALAITTVCGEPSGFEDDRVFVYNTDIDNPSMFYLGMCYTDMQLDSLLGAYQSKTNKGKLAGVRYEYQGCWLYHCMDDMCYYGMRVFSTNNAKFILHVYGNTFRVGDTVSVTPGTQVFHLSDWPESDSITISSYGFGSLDLGNRLEITTCNGVITELCVALWE